MGERMEGAPDDVDKPDEVGYLYGWWLKLYSASKLTYSELKAFTELTGIDLKPWQVDAIMSIDYEYQRALNHGNSR
jgi:hypothetical protein